MLQFSAYVFDISVSEALTTLINGKCVCIPSEEERLADLAGFISRAKVDWAFLTPTVARLLDPAKVPTLKTLLLGGEFVGQDNVSTWSQRLELIIISGICETTIYSTARLIQEKQTRAENVGYAIGSVHWLVQPSNADQLVPIGAVGEMLTEGPIVAKGYLNNPKATKEAFIGSPAWAQDPAISAKFCEPRRFYLTGDLARLNAHDGSLSIVGRKGTQVKIRGQRIELQEVEKQLTQLPAVDHAIAMLPDSGPFQGRLTSVFSLHHLDAQLPTILDIRQISTTETHRAIAKFETGLSERLPRSMVPTCWVCVEQMPRTLNGKLDRVRIKNWLLSLDEETVERSKNVVLSKAHAVDAPVTEIEASIRQIWSRVLRIHAENISCAQSFYQLGGDSISAMRIMSECRQAGWDVTVQNVLRAKTISKLAADTKPLKVEEHEGVPGDNTARRTKDFPLSAIQRIHVRRDPELRKRNNQSILVSLEQFQAPKAIRCALETIVDNHPMLRARVFNADGGRWRQKVIADTDSSLDFRVVRLESSGRLDHCIRLCQELVSPLSGPTLGARLFQTELEHDLLFLTAPHMFIDLVSWSTMLSDLEQYLQSGAITPARHFLFADWCLHQGKLPSCPTPVMPAADLDYWGINCQLNRYADTAATRVSVPMPITATLLGSANSPFETEFVDLMLGSIIQAFADTFSDRQPPPVYFEGHGREPPDGMVDMSRCVGWFTTMYPILVNGTDVRTSIRQVKDSRKQAKDDGVKWFSTFAGHDTPSSGEHTLQWPVEVLFNYHGLNRQLEQKDGILSTARNVAVDTHDVDYNLDRLSLLNIEVGVADEQAWIEIVYNRHMKHQGRVKSWLTNTLQILGDVADTFPSQPRGMTMSAYPHFGGTYAELDSLGTVLAAQYSLSDSNCIEDIVPCSAMQETMMELERSRPGICNTHFVFRVRGHGAQSEVSREHFEHAWQKVVDRHSILRTIVVKDMKTSERHWQVILRHHQISVREARSDISIQQSRRAPPQKYAQELPPHTMSKHHDSTGDAFFVLDISHVLFDASSKTPLYRDISLALDGQLRLVDTCQFATAHDEDFAHHRPSYQFWQDYVAHTQPCFLICCDHEPDGLSHEHASAVVSIPPSSAFRKVCTRDSTTVGNLFMAAWAVLLSCFTGRTDVCFEYVSAGRDKRIQGIDDAVGPFFKKLVSKANITSDITLLQVVEATSEDNLDRLPHQDVSLPAVARVLSDRRVHALYNTGVNYKRVYHSELAGGSPAYTIEEVDVISQPEVSTAAIITLATV